MCTRYVGVFLGKVLESHRICFLAERGGWLLVTKRVGKVGSYVN